MDNTRIDFDIRVKEIEEYFAFLVIIDKENTFLKYKNNFKDENFIEKKISSNLQRIFIANSFLILYNLVESTIRNSIVEIYNKIHEDEVSYNNLSNNLKKLWLQKTAKKIKNNNSSEKSIKNSLQKIIENIVENEVIELTVDKLEISGNIDAQKIRDLAKMIGFDKTDNEKRGSNLETIKTKRQHLAHGNYTFYEIGKDFTVKEIINFKNETIEYLSNVIDKIEKFIDNKKYKIEES